MGVVVRAGMVSALLGAYRAVLGSMEREEAQATPTVPFDPACIACTGGLAEAMRPGAKIVLCSPHLHGFERLRRGLTKPTVFHFVPKRPAPLPSGPPWPLVATQLDEAATLP